MRAMLLPLCLSLPGAWGQPLPDALRTLCESGQPVGYTTEVNAAARDYLWRGASVNPGGFLEVQVDSRYLGLIDRLQTLATPVPTDGPQPWPEVRHVATFDESPFRQSTFYSDPVGRIMLRTWQFGKEKATICVVTDFLNADVAGVRATLALNKAVPHAEKVLWKLT